MSYSNDSTAYTTSPSTLPLTMLTIRWTPGSALGEPLRMHWQLTGDRGWRGGTSGLIHLIPESCKPNSSPKLLMLLGKALKEALPHQTMWYASFPLERTPSYSMMLFCHVLNTWDRLWNSLRAGLSSLEQRMGHRFRR